MPDNKYIVTLERSDLDKEENNVQLEFYFDYADQALELIRTALKFGIFVKATVEFYPG